MKWEWIKELLGDILIIWWGGWTLFVFSWIGLFGEMRAVEPNHWILIIEWLLCACGIILGIERLIKDIRNRRHNDGSRAA